MIWVLVSLAWAGERGRHGAHDVDGLPHCRDLDAAAAPASSAPSADVSTARWAARLALRTYQVAISPADGAGCSFYPSCSSYTIEAVRRNGVVLGSVMGTERIQSSHSGWDYPLCQAGGRAYLYDPVRANDEWLPRWR